ncbi:MAG: hypothetical protein ACLP8S_23905 [Solirubrobacteraceae bacterium]
MLFVGAMVVFIVLKDALRRITDQSVVVGARGVSRTEVALGIAVVLRLLERIGEAAVGRRARPS